MFFMKKYSQDLDEYPMQVWGGGARQLKRGGLGGAEPPSAFHLRTNVNVRPPDVKTRCYEMKKISTTTQFD